MSILGKMMGVSHTTISTWEYVKNNANEKQIEDLRNGKVTPNKVAAQLKAAEKQRLLIQQAKFINSKYLLPDQATIYCGDFRDPAILAKIPDGSVSLILLDPIYAEEYWYLYEALPPIVMAKLKPNGHFVSLFGDTLKRRFMNILEAEGLIYNTDISIQLQGPFSHDQHLHISRKKKDFLWYYKGPELITNGLLQNLIPSQRPEKDLHEWQQSTKGSRRNHFKTNISRYWRCSIANGVIEENKDRNPSLKYPCSVANRFECPYDYMKGKVSNAKFDVEGLFELASMAFAVEIALAVAREKILQLSK